MVLKKDILTKFLLAITLILLVVGIPVSTIYWWPQFWGPQFSNPGYWSQWVHWLNIAFIILAALWILDLIIWKREWILDIITPIIPRKKKGEAELKIPKFPSSREDWRVNEHGQAFHLEDEPNSESINFGEPTEFNSSQSNFEHIEKSLINQKINRFIEEGKITIKEAEAIRRQTMNMNFLDSENFLSAIAHRAEKGRQERDTSLDSISKKYGIDPNKFKL